MAKQLTEKQWLSTFKKYEILNKYLFWEHYAKLRGITTISIEQEKQFDGKKEIVVIVIIKNYGPTLQATLRGFKQI